MKIKVKTPPTQEPIILEDAKAFLRIDSSLGAADDALITALIKAAREMAESYTNQSMATQTLQLAFDKYPRAVIHLPKGPLQSVSSITLYAEDGSTTSVPVSDYIIDDYGDTIVRKDTSIEPTVTLQAANGFVVEYVAGYTDTPEEVKQAMYLYIKGQYESIPPQDYLPAVKSLLYPYKVVTV